MPFVSITRLRIRSIRFLPSFFFYAAKTGRQASAADGNLSVQVLRDSKWTFWTQTVWTTEAAMRAYMLAAPHGPVMRKLMDWCDEASVAHWTQDHEQPVEWTEAYARIKSIGRKSKVNHPSPAHDASDIAPPVVRAGNNMRLK